MSIPSNAGTEGGFWGRLTSRERTLILALVLTAFFMGTLLIVYLRINRLREARNEIDEYKNAIGQVYTRGAVYQERLAEKKKRESKIATEEIQFLTLVEEAQASIEGLTVADQEEQRPEDLGGGLVKKSFRFRLHNVTLTDAIKFLSDIESQPSRIILTEKLLVRSASSIEDRLNLDVTLATWERQDLFAEDEEEEEPE